MYITEGMLIASGSTGSTDNKLSTHPRYVPTNERINKMTTYMYRLSKAAARMLVVSLVVFMEPARRNTCIAPWMRASITSITRCWSTTECYRGSHGIRSFTSGCEYFHWEIRKESHFFLSIETKVLVSIRRWCLCHMATWMRNIDPFPKPFGQSAPPYSIYHGNPNEWQVDYYRTDLKGKHLLCLLSHFPT